MGSVTACFARVAKTLSPEDREAILKPIRDEITGRISAASKADPNADANAVALEVLDGMLAGATTPSPADGSSASPRGAKTAAGKPVEPAKPAPVAAATHQDPGEKPEAATPAVVAESIQTAADNRNRKPSEMRAELLRDIQAALLQAPDYSDYETAVRSMGQKDADEAFTTSASRGALGDRFAPRGYSQPTRTFKVPGDGVFTVNNTARQLLKFRKAVESSPGFRQARGAPAAERATDALDARGPRAVITNMIDEGDPQAAVDYAAARSLTIADVLKGDKVRLPKVAGLEPTAEQVGEFEPETAEAAPAPAKKTAAKVAPLYASRPVINAQAIINWAASQGFKSTLPAADLHVTVAYSSKPMDGASVPATSAAVSASGGARTVEPLGNEGAVVLKFASPEMRARWKQYRDAGASWDYDSYTPHITITYDGNGVDLSKVVPYAGPIELGAEKQEALNEDKASDYKATEQPPEAASQPNPPEPLATGREVSQQEAPKPPKAKPGEVDNFGEALPPARRAMAAKLDESLSDDDIANRPLSEIWPLAENEAIEDTFAAAVAHAARAEVPAKPRQPYKLKQWVQKVKTVRELAGMVVSGRVSRDVLAEQIKGPRRALADWWSKVQLLEQIPRDQWKRVEAVEERPDAAVFREGKSVPAPMVRVRIDGQSHWLESDGTLAGAMEQISALLKTGEPEKRMEFEVRQRRSDGAIFVNKKGDPEYRELMTFPTADAARAAIKDQYDDLVGAWEAIKARDNITERDLRSAENRPRAGKDHRNGRDVTPEQFQEAFGFRGGEFGKWVEQGKGDKERQSMLNGAYDALMDLADIVGVPPRAISLNGTLGIAFGSRGSGWASAHYEPSNLVINLTKTRGAGALAHEWFHALDNYFSRMRRGGEESKFTGDQAKYRTENYITHMPEPLMVRKDRGRYFPPMTSGKLEAMHAARKHQTDNYNPEKWERDPRAPEGVRPEVEQRFAALVQALDESPMTQRARMLDGKKSGDGYWSRTLERAARAFESYVIAKMHEQGYHNDFLVNVRKSDETGKAGERYPYLLAGEVKPIADAFDRLFGEIKTKVEDDRVAMFSLGNDGQFDPTNPDILLRVDAAELAPETAQAYATASDADQRAVRRLQTSMARYIPGLRLDAAAAAGGRDAGQPLQGADRARVAAAELLRALTGRRAVYFRSSGGPVINGVHSSLGPDVLFLRHDATRPHMAVLGHEFLHGLRKDRPDLYDVLRDRIRLVSTRRHEPGADLQEKRRKLGLAPLSAEALEEEFLADVMGDSWMDAGFWKSLAGKEPNTLLRRAFTAAMRFVDDVLRKIADLNPFGTNAYLSDIKAARAAMAQALRDYVEVESVGAPAADLNFSAGSDAPWYSALAREIGAARMNVAGPAAWQQIIDGMVKAGKVKADEVEWSGVREWLGLQQGKVTREAVSGYLRDNGVRVQETVMGGGDAFAELDRAIVEADALGFTFARDVFEDGDEYTGRAIQFQRRRDGVVFGWNGRNFVVEDYPSNMEEDSIDPPQDALIDVARDIKRIAEEEQTGADADGTRYSQYTLPGGPLSRDTEILSRDGWLRMDEVQIGDIVMTRRDEDGRLEWQEVEAVPTVFADKLYHFKNQSIDMRVTACHNMLVKRRRRSSGGLFRAKAADLWSMAECVAPLVGEWHGEPTADLYGYRPEDAAELIGWYIAEGSAVSDGGKKSTLSISQCREANSEKCARIEALLNRMGIAWSYVASGPAYLLSIKTMDRGLVEVLHAQGDSRNKFVPGFILSQPPAVLRSLMNGMLLGDGHLASVNDPKREPRWAYFTNCKRLADDMQTLALLCGLRATIGQRPTGLYEVRLNSKQWASIDDAKHAIVDYNDTAFCVTVKNHAIYVRTGGVAAFTGNSNYREVLLTLPAKGTPLSEDALPSMRREQARADRAAGDYRSGHWDQPNVLAHIRVNDRTDADGKRVLFVEEIQSDWAQEGKKRGWFDKRTQEAAAMVREGLARGERPTTEQQPVVDGLLAIRNAPFVDKTDKWVALAIKRVIKMAVDEGYDRVAFVTGEQSAERYDLSKQVKEITYEPTDKGYFLNVMTIDGRNALAKNLTREEVADTVGKDLLDKMERREGRDDGAKDPDLKGTYTLSGLDLKVGGEGMRAFYDRIVPSVLKDVLRKVGGGQMGTVQIGAQREISTNVDDGAGGVIKRRENTGAMLQQPGFDITPAMRERAAGGMPMFSMAQRQAQTDTPEFKRWFAGSAVVDAQGRPLVVYHGTGRDVEVFSSAAPTATDKGGWGRGFYFAADPGYAAVYARKGAAPNVMPVYVSLRNPIVVAADGEWSARANAIKALGLDVPRGDPRAEWATEFTEAAQAKGHDGVINTIGGRPAEVVAFRPEQIKSATGNNGQFDPGNPDIRFSLGSTVDTLQSNDTARRLSERVIDVLRSDSTIGLLGRTVGTPYHLAHAKRADGSLRNPDLRKVYDEAQDYLNDINTFANDPAELAPGVVPMLNKWSDARRPLRLAGEQRAKLARALFEGTLGWTRDDQGNAVQTDDPHKGIEWTGTELRQRFGFNDADVKLYQQTRAAIGRSLDLMAGAEVARQMGGRDLPEGLRAMVSRGDTGRFKGLVLGFLTQQVDAAESAVRTLKAEHREQLARFAEATPGPDTDAMRDALKARQAAALEQAEAKLGKWKSLQAGVQKTYERVEDLKDRGYMPLMRFGPHTVTVRDIDTKEVVFFGMYETQAEANVEARKLRETAEPNEAVSRGEMSQEQWRLFKGMSPETVELFGQVAGIERTPVFEEYIRRTKANHSALKRLIQRKGTPGFSEDVQRVLAAFLTSNARAAAANLHAGAMEEATLDIDQERGLVKDYATKLTQYVQNPTDEAQWLRGLMFTQFIGGSVASAMVNMTQPFTMTLPWLSQHGGPVGAARLLTAGMRSALTRIAPDSDLGKAMARAEKDGIVSPQALHELQGQAVNRIGRLESGLRAVGVSTKAAETFDATLRRVLFAWGGFFSLAEQFNRRATFIAAYQLATEQRMADPFAFAAEAVSETQGVYNRGNRPQWARGPVGATVMTFKQYSIAYVEFLSRLPRREKAIALFVLMIAAGLEGLPFTDDLDDLIDTIAQRLFGKAFSAKRAKVELLSEIPWLGRDGAEWVLRGASALPGFPVDLAGRMSLGNMIPGTGLLRTDGSRDKSSEVLEALGPAGGVLRDAIGEGSLVERFAPVAMRNAAKAVEMNRTGEYRDKLGRKVADVDTADAAAKGLGFQPREIARESRDSRMAQSVVAQTRAAESEIVRLWAQGIVDGEPDKVTQAQEKLAAWNERNPDARIAINRVQIARMARDMRATREDRVIRAAPKELRGRVAEELR